MYWLQVLICTSNNKNVLIILGVFSISSTSSSKIVQFLFYNGFSVKHLQASQVDQYLDVITLVDFIEKMPSHIITYLLHHFLELRETHPFFLVITRIA